MKTYRYYDIDDKFWATARDITEDEILDDYWNFWSDKMIKKYGYGHELITKENCIHDWLVTNWAWEKKDEGDSETKEL